MVQLKTKTSAYSFQSLICEQHTKLFKIELTSCLKQGMSKNKPNAQKMYNRKDNENYYQKEENKTGYRMVSKNAVTLVLKPDFCFMVVNKGCNGYYSKL